MLQGPKVEKIVRPLHFKAEIIGLEMQLVTGRIFANAFGFYNQLKLKPCAAPSNSAWSLSCR